MKILTTVGRECFEVEFLHVGHSGGRDGVLYLFRLNDLLKDRGHRMVSLFRSGTDRVFIENYDERVESVRLNVLRRAFDSGAFSFETPIEQDRYHELRLRAEDFKAQRKASDETIRDFIKFGAYIFGFKFRPTGNIPFVEFNSPEDLEYLGAKPEDIERNLWLLMRKGYLEKSIAATLVNPLRCSPTSALVDEIENSPHSAQLKGATVTQHIHMYGHNARINTNSTDSSVNNVTVSDNRIFVKIREAAQTISDESARAAILERLESLERAKGSSKFLDAYQSFIGSIADHMTVFGPFLPALSAMLSGS